jgi:hypothetical protein
MRNSLGHLEDTRGVSGARPAHNGAAKHAWTDEDSWRRGPDRKRHRDVGRRSGHRGFCDNQFIVMSVGRPLVAKVQISAQ